MPRLNYIVIKMKYYIGYLFNVLLVEIETLFIIFTLYDGLRYLALCFLFSVFLAVCNGFFYIFTFRHRFNTVEIVIETICYFCLFIYIAKHINSFMIPAVKPYETYMIFLLPSIILLILMPFYLYFKKVMLRSKWYITKYNRMLLCLPYKVRDYPILKFFIFRKNVHKMHISLLYIYIIIVLCVFYIKYH